MPWRSVLYCTVLLDLTVYLPRTTGRPTTNAQIIISGRNLHSDVIVLRWIPQTNDHDRPGRLSVRERAHRNNKSAVVGRHAARSNQGIPRNDDNLTGTNDGRRTEIALRAHYVTSRAEAAPRQPLNPTIYKLLIMRDGRLPLANKIIISSSVLAARRHRKGRFLLTSWMLMLMLSLKVWWSDKSFRLFCSKCFMWHFDVNRFFVQNVRCFRAVYACCQCVVCCTSSFRRWHGKQMSQVSWKKAASPFPFCVWGSAPQSDTYMVPFARWSLPPP